MTVGANSYLPLSSSLQVSESALRVGQALGHLPLASASDLSGVVMLSSSMVHSRLWELREAGLADFSVMGWSRQAVGRWWLTGRGLELVPGHSAAWHLEGGRCWLLDVLPSVEWFYRILGEVEGLGSFQEFTWLTDVAMHAAARFERGWVALVWSGLLQIESVVMARMDRFSSELRSLAVDNDPPWPSLFCYVVSDPWQQELVFRAAGHHALRDRLACWSVTNGARSGATEPLASRGWVRSYVRERREGAWTWDNRLSGWYGSLVPSAGRVLDLACEWPGMEMRLVRSFFQESESNRYSYRLMSGLKESGLLAVGKDDFPKRFGLTGPGSDLLSRRDRLDRRSLSKRHQPGGWDMYGRLEAHELGVRQLVGDLLYQGCAGASGWRSWEHLGGAGGISPDAIVRLNSSPYGPGWHYVEYERSARGMARIRRKLSGFHSARRQDRWPVMVVAWDDGSEKNFWLAARERGGLPMLTTTVARLKKHGAAGNSACWSVYGRPVFIG